MMIVGKIRDAHGMKGEVFVAFFAQKAEWLDKTKTLQLEGVIPNSDGRHQAVQQAMTIEKYRLHKKGAIIKFEEVSTRTEAERLIGHSVAVSNDALISAEGERIFLSEIEGFDAYNNDVLLGKVSGFSSNGAQDLALIEKDGVQREIPLIQPFIQDIHWKDKKIVFILPEGLVDS